MPQVCLAEKVQAFVQKQTPPPPHPTPKQTNKQTPPTPEMSTLGKCLNLFMHNYN